MATHSGAVPGRENADRPDGQYAFVAGLYVAALLAPAAVLALSRVVGDAAVLYVGFLAAVTALTAAAGWAVSRTRGLAVGLGRRDAVWFLAVLPFAWFGGVFGAAAAGLEPPGVAAPLAVVGTAGGLLLGLLLVAMSRTRHADAVLADAPERAAWEARWPRQWRRGATAVTVVAFAASAAGFVATVAFGVDRAWMLYYLLFVAIPLTSATNPRTFRVTDAGLVIEHPFQRQLRPWTAFATYDVTDDALLVRPAAWWRPAHRSAREDVDDLDAVVAALDEALPRGR